MQIFLNQTILFHTFTPKPYKMITRFATLLLPEILDCFYRQYIPGKYRPYKNTYSTLDRFIISRRMLFNGHDWWCTFSATDTGITHRKSEFAHDDFFVENGIYPHRSPKRSYKLFRGAGNSILYLYLVTVNGWCSGPSGFAFSIIRRSSAVLLLVLRTKANPHPEYCLFQHNISWAAVPLDGSFRAVQLRLPLCFQENSSRCAIILFSITRCANQFRFLPFNERSFSRE